jgi:two-component system cell cycle sensor histidine kinase/response regulator CckA
LFPLGGSPLAKKILLVEDDLQLQGLLKRTLEDAGYELLTAKDGDRAFRLWQAYDGEFALLITDVILPGINGIDLVQLVESQWPDTKILLMSGEIDSSSLMDYRRETTRLLTKPLDMDSFLQAVRDLLPASLR